MMKTPLRYRVGNRGFSMIELMTVIGILILLAGILLAALPGIQNRVNRNRVETFMAELQAGLENYKIDNGIYPLNPPSGDSASARDTSGIIGSGVLYKHLSGDFNGDGEVDFDRNEEVYVSRLSFEENKSSKDGRSMSVGGEFLVVDPYGDPFRYLAQPPNIAPSARLTRNPTFDLWSIAGADPTNPAEQSSHITNWQFN